MNAHEFLNYELQFDLNNPCIPIEEEIIGMFDGGGDAPNNEPIEEVDNVQISDVVVDKAIFKDVESASVTLKKNWNKDLRMLHLSSRTFQHFKKELGS